MDIRSLLMDFDIKKLDEKLRQEQANKSMILDLKTNDTSDKEPNVIELSPKEVFIKRCDSKASKRGFVPYANGEYYGRQLTRYTEVYVQRQGNGLWMSWRGTWKSGDPKPSSERMIVENTDFETALKGAVVYITRFKLRGR